MNPCDRCGKSPGTPQSPYDLHDCCGVCFKNLCSDCMAKGCCGNVPAKSGMDADYGEEEEAEKDV